MFRSNLWLAGCLGLVALAATAQAQTRTHRAVGVVQTGPNNLCGDQVWTLANVPAGPESSGAFLGRLDPTSGSTTPLAISPADCDPIYGTGGINDLVVTNYDDAFGAVRGWTAPNAKLENEDLRNVPVNAGNGVFAPIPLPGGVPPNPLPPTITEPTYPISLSNWLEASGDLEIVCNDVDSTASVAARLTNLIPHGTYTIWGQWVDPSDELLTVPFGGLPNTIVADRNGTAEFCREIQFCPIDLAPDGSDLQFLSVVYMAGGVTFGAVPYEAFTTRAFVGIASLPFLSTIPGGIISFDQLGFRINATGGPDPGPTSPLMCAPPAVSAASLSPWGRGLLGALIVFSAGTALRRSLPNGTRSRS